MCFAVVQSHILKCASLLHHCLVSGNATSSERKQLEMVVHTASKIIGHAIPTVASIYATWTSRRKC